MVNPTEILLRADETIRQKTRNLQNAATASVIGAITLPFVFYVVVFFPLMVLPVIPLVFGVVQALSVVFWRVSSNSMHILASARLLDRKKFVRWFVAAVFICLLSPVGGVLLMLAMWH